ncbi:MAG TPA: hypothetical protein VFA68_11200 [Terriglobales bacterium]|nr:hypothetical protein [Terriglobales bacterium]
MARIITKGGTFREGETLCRTCRFAHIQRGYRESEEVIFCDYSYTVLRKVPFKVAECTDFIDRTVPTRYEMEKMALVINVEPARNLIGFDRELGCGQEDGSSEDEIEVSAKD